MAGVSLFRSSTAALGKSSDMLSSSPVGPRLPNEPLKKPSSPASEPCVALLRACSCVTTMGSSSVHVATARWSRTTDSLRNTSLPIPLSRTVSANASSRPSRKSSPNQFLFLAFSTVFGLLSFSLITVFKY